MWSHVSHQPPMSKNIGETGFGQWRSSKIQKTSRSPSDHSIGKDSSPKKVPSACSVSTAIRADLRGTGEPMVPRCLKPAVLAGERDRLVVRRHEVGAAVLRDDDRAAGVAEPRRLVPAEPLHVAVEETGGERVAGAEDVVHVDGE